MKVVHIVDNRTKKETHVIPVCVPDPVDYLFVRDRSTKEKYLMIRTHGEDPFEGHKQLHPVPYDQYDYVTLNVEEI